MGCWNGTDMITHLPIMWQDPVRCVVIAELVLKRAEKGIEEEAPDGEEDE